MNIRLLTAMALTVCGAPVAAQETDASPEPGFEAVIAAHILPLERDADGGFSGAGWDRMMADAERAQFFLVGEQHASADIVEAAAAIHRGLAARGFDHMAVEIGPWSTRYAEALIRGADDPIDAIRDAPGDGYGLPFLFFAEDTELVAQAIALSLAEAPVLWGLDQEFVAGASILAERLETLARTPEQNAAVAAFAAAAAQDPMYLGAAEADAFDALRNAFDTGADAEALALVDAIRLSNGIYGPFMRRSGPIYPANLARENYMKRNFLDHFERAEARDGVPPRVFFKFGANHMMRGRTLTNVPALGDFLVEWGRARDFDVVNVMIDCLSGESTDVLSGRIVPCESYALDEGSLLARATEGQAVALIDLRPLRALIRSSTEIDEASRQTIFAFDYYLGIADVGPATLIPEPMQPPQ